MFPKYEKRRKKHSAGGLSVTSKVKGNLSKLSPKIREIIKPVGIRTETHSEPMK